MQPKTFIYWWQELALYMKCVIASMFHWINGVSRGKMKFREEKWIWLIFPHETPFFLCETSFFRTKIHLSNEARNFDSQSLTETAFQNLNFIQLHNSSINAWRGQDPSRAEPVGSWSGTRSTADRGDRELLFATVQRLSYQIPYKSPTQILLLSNSTSNQ